MRILVHDYAGHPFQLQLSRSLAARGHEVLHTYSASTHTPQGAKVLRENDSETLRIQPLSLSEMIDKFSFVKRRTQELEYGSLLAGLIQKERPEVIISGNTPTEAQFKALKVCESLNIPFVSWIQDLYGLAAQRLLRKKLGALNPIAWLVGSYLINMDRYILRKSAANVLITEDFLPILEKWRVHKSHCHVIHNWAPLQEMPQRPRDNQWARKQDVLDTPCLIYSGTLAMKHNPELLLSTAQAVRDKGATVLVISEGPGPEWLAAQAEKRGIDNIRILPFQPFEELPDVLASADILLAILEPEAGVFSVPSKVLTYLCAGRAVLLAIPSENLAARIVKNQDAGLLVEPDDLDGFGRAAQQLLNESSLRERLSYNARTYADKHFDIIRITDHFEGIFQSVIA